MELKMRRASYDVPATHTSCKLTCPPRHTRERLNEACLLFVSARSEAVAPGVKPRQAVLPPTPFSNALWWPGPMEMSSNAVSALPWMQKIGNVSLLRTDGQANSCLVVWCSEQPRGRERSSEEKADANTRRWLDGD